MVASEPILDELREHLRDKTKLAAEKIAEVIQRVRELAIVVAPAEVPANTCRDPDDLLVLGTAVAGQADVLVTGDKDLLVLGRYQTIPILSPRDFHERFQLSL